MADTLDPVGLPAATGPARPGTPVPGGSPPPVIAEDGKVMSLVDHLGELRNRIVKSVLAIGVFATLGFYLSDTVISVLRAALPAGVPPL